MKYINILFILLFLSVSSFAQEKKDISSMTRDQILEMSIDEMTDLPLEDLMKMVEIAGVSSLDELYALLNKDVTSASKSEENLFDSPLSTTVLSQEEIMASGATSIEEALRLVPGIIVREKTNGNYDVQIRGNQNMPQGNMLLYSENTTTLVMVDGRPVFNYGMGGILWETLPVSLGEINRIEVVRGPSSALYGPNAVDGVINLITNKIDKNSPLVSANVQGGSQSTYVGDLSLSKAFSDKFSAGVSTYYEYRDRNTDKIYAFPDTANGWQGDFVDLDTYAELNAEHKWSNDSANQLYVDNDPRRAKQKIGGNAYINYRPNKNLSFSLAGGYLTSEANSSPLGDNATSFNVRQSNGGYLNFISTVYGFNLNASLSNVLQDFHRGHNGWKQATEQYNVSLDYLLRFGGLQIRPGVSYQSVYYDDRDHVDSVGTGFFNDRVALRNFSASARFDYNINENIRLVAALRGEKYNVPDKWMPSYQFVGSYKINENNVFRAVYSRANQSTFMINAFSNYTWDLSALESVPDKVGFSGNSDPSMMTMDMIEIGFRSRPSKALFIDVEAYYNKAKDFSALMPDGMMAITPYDEDKPTSWFKVPLPVHTTLYTSHREQGVESEQIGMSVSIDAVLTSKLLLKGHLNYQQTTLDNSLGKSRDEVAGLQFMTSVGNPPDPRIPNNPPPLPGTFFYDLGELPQGGPEPKERYRSNLQYPQSEYEANVKNEAIPAFWGSLALIYRPTAKWEILPQAYYYGNYTFNTQYGLKEMDNKLTLNAKVSYKASKSLTVFLNGRNIFNNETQEYPYMDTIGGLYLAGLNFRY